MSRWLRYDTTCPGSAYNWGGFFSVGRDGGYVIYSQPVLAVAVQESWIRSIDRAPSSAAETL